MELVSYDLSKTVKEMHIFSDSCLGQNINHTVVKFLATLAANGRFNKIFQYFPVRRSLTGMLGLLKKFCTE
jgi:hypothetical protein